jgi:hypothetical protein
VSPRDRFADVPEVVFSIIMKLLSKTAKERYQTAAGVASDLQRCLDEWDLPRAAHWNTTCCFDLEKLRSSCEIAFEIAFEHDEWVAGWPCNRNRR